MVGDCGGAFVFVVVGVVADCVSSEGGGSALTLSFGGAGSSSSDAML